MKFQETLKGHKTLITGAGSGIGRAAAIRFADAGSSVALLGRTRDELEVVHDAIGGASGGHLILMADVSDEAAMVEAYDELARDWGDLDSVIANAGINGVWAPLEQLKVEEWNQTLDINLRGTFLTVKLALPYLRKKGGGSVMVVSSVNGNRIFSNSGATAYSCSKAAQVAFTRMLALELASDGIRVNAVCPGAIETNINDSTERRGTDAIHLPVEFPEGEVPLTGGHPGVSDDVARVLWFLASDASSHISGTEIYVDGAQSLLQG